jgi:hypothetical protein
LNDLLKKSKLGLLAIIFSWVMALSMVAMPNTAQAQMDPRVKALITVAAYGTVGGALLGFASMAFNSNGRAIFQGASLGLYAGIIFGTYIIVSYESKKSGSKDGDYYPDAPPGPYENQSYQPLLKPQWDAYLALDEQRYNEFRQKTSWQGTPDLTVGYVDLVKFQF